jgi:iron complex transport system substrate-binding protein
MIHPDVRGLFLNQKLPFFLVSVSIMLFSCTRNTTKTANDPKITEKPILSYAKRLKIEYIDGYSQVSVLNPWQGASNIAQTWYLISEGDKTPSFIDTSSVIKVPVKKIICMSTTHLSMISALDKECSVVGFSGTRFIYDPELLRYVSIGGIHEIGFDDNLNKEMILKLDPDIVMVYGIGSESAGYIAKLKEMGVKVMYNADYLETDPLGKAEWIKLMGALYSREKMADSIFRIIENEYNNLKSFISSNVSERPSVMLGLPFKDTWYISPGNSYISALIADAGGKYLWQDTESSVSMPTGLENVFLKSISADYWLNSGSANSLDEILSIDPRLARLRCFKNGNVFNNIKRINAGGGNDYWEGGCLKPQILLRDIASILHPGLLPSAELYYYKRLN